MTSIFLVFLFIIQIIGFYFLALLYTKMSKFDDLEKKQRRLMSEMDDSIAAYLSELKDENDRLVERLAMKSKEFDKPSNGLQMVQQSLPVEEAQPTVPINAPKLPIRLALKSYDAVSTRALELEKVEVDDRTRAFNLHDAGKSVEEIAKTLGKGRTEVELFLKFR